MQYEWNGHSFNVPAQEVGELFERIEEENGVLTPELILAEAEKEDSILHDLLEWDKDKAFYEYHLLQIQTIRRCLVIKMEVPEQKVVKVRAFTNVSEEKKGVYVNFSKAAETPEYREIVLRKALRDLDVYLLRYDTLEQIVSLINMDAFNALKEKMGF